MTREAAATSPLRAFKDPALPLPETCDDERAWLAALRCIPADRAATLLSVARTLCPHDALPDAVYRRVVLQIDRACEGQPQALGWVTESVAALDAHFGLPFAGLSESYRVTALKALAGMPAFRFLQRATVRFLYDDLAVWQAFGYEGASYPHGGYVDRGFNDLAWLPPVPLEPLR